MKALLLVTSLFMAAQAGALDLTFTGDVANTWFTGTSSPTATSSAVGQQWPYGMSFTAAQELSEEYFLKAGFTWDTILRRRAYFVVETYLPGIRLGVGPFIGINNVDREPLLSGYDEELGYYYYFYRGLESLQGFGMILNGDFQSPGLGFFGFSWETTFQPLFMVGQESQSRIYLKAGLAFTNGLAWLETDLKRFSERLDGYVLHDDQKRYGVRTELFFKNSPFRYNAGAAFQTKERRFDAGDSYATYDILVDSTFHLDFSPGPAFFVGAEASPFLHMPIWKQVSADNTSTYTRNQDKTIPFKVWAGFTLRFRGAEE